MNLKKKDLVNKFKEKRLYILKNTKQMAKNFAERKRRGKKLFTNSNKYLKQKRDTI